MADEPFTGGPRLPSRQPNGEAWPAATKTWWASVSSMPHCCIWQRSDWQYAVDTAYVAAAFHDGNLRMAAELRNREKVLGTTLDARLGLHIRVVEALEPEAGGVAPSCLDEYRRRIFDDEYPHPPSA